MCEEIRFGKYPNITVSYEYKVFYAFWKKIAVRKISFVWSLTPLVKAWGTSLDRQFFFLATDPVARTENGWFRCFSMFKSYLCISVLNEGNWLLKKTDLVDFFEEKKFHSIKASTVFMQPLTLNRVSCWNYSLFLLIYTNMNMIMKIIRTKKSMKKNNKNMFIAKPNKLKIPCCHSTDRIYFLCNILANPLNPPPYE